MPTFPRSPYHSVRRVFPSTAGRLAFQAVPSWVVGGLSPLPACPVRCPVCIRPSCTSWSPLLSRTVSGRGLDCVPPWRVISPPPQGPSLGSGGCPRPPELVEPWPAAATVPAAPRCLVPHACGAARSGHRVGSRSWRSLRSPRGCSGPSSRLVVSEQRLNHPNVRAALEQMGRETMAKRMQRERLAQPAPRLSPLP
jgi:hypothetical protein